MVHETRGFIVLLQLQFYKGISGAVIKCCLSPWMGKVKSLSSPYSWQSTLVSATSSTLHHVTRDIITPTPLSGVLVHHELSTHFAKFLQCFNATHLHLLGRERHCGVKLLNYFLICPSRDY